MIRSMDVYNDFSHVGTLLGTLLNRLCVHFDKLWYVRCGTFSQYVPEKSTCGGVHFTGLFCRLLGQSETQVFREIQRRQGVAICRRVLLKARIHSRSMIASKQLSANTLAYKRLGARNSARVSSIWTLIYRGVLLIWDISKPSLTLRKIYSWVY